jgi:hypothetical protein
MNHLERALLTGWFEMFSGCDSGKCGISCAGVSEGLSSPWPVPVEGAQSSFSVARHSEGSRLSCWRVGTPFPQLLIYRSSVDIWA